MKPTLLGGDPCTPIKFGLTKYKGKENIWRNLNFFDMDNHIERKKPGPNKYDPRSYPYGNVVGLWEPTQAERIQYEQQAETKKTKKDTWREEETKTR